MTNTSTIVVPVVADKQVLLQQAVQIVDSMGVVTANLTGAAKSPDFEDIAQLAIMELFRMGRMLDLVCKRAGGTLIDADAADQMIHPNRLLPIEQMTIENGTPLDPDFVLPEDENGLELEEDDDEDDADFDEEDDDEDHFEAEVEADALAPTLPAEGLAWG